MATAGNPIGFPYLWEKKGETENPSLIAAWGELYNSATHLQNRGPKPIFPRTECQSTLEPLWTGQHTVVEGA